MYRHVGLLSVFLVCSLGAVPEQAEVKVIDAKTLESLVASYHDQDQNEEQKSPYADAEPWKKLQNSQDKVTKLVAAFNNGENVELLQYIDNYYS